MYNTGTFGSIILEGKTVVPINPNSSGFVCLCATAVLFLCSRFCAPAMAAIVVSALPGSYSYVRGHGCRVVGGPAVASTLAGARLASRLVSSRRWRASDLGRALRTTGRRAYDGRSIRGGGISLARAVWKQEVLWTEAPIADIGFAAEQHFHLVLDISANRELRDGHTKPGQFVQVRMQFCS